MLTDFLNTTVRYIGGGADMRVRLDGVTLDRNRHEVATVSYANGEGEGRTTFSCPAHLIYTGR